MKEHGTRTAHNHKQDPGWLQRENPPVHYMLLAMEGDEDAFRWLEGHSRGLSLFTRAITGDKKAVAALRSGKALELDDLFGIIGTSDLPGWFSEKHPDLHMLFAAIRGDDDAFHHLRKRSAIGRVAQVVRELAGGDGGGAGPAGGEGPAALPEDSAADVGCLVGELHLSKGDYAKAIEAFTRAIEKEPTPDAYEGRARAYQGLADRDERRAAELRLQSFPHGAGGERG